MREDLLKAIRQQDCDADKESRLRAQNAVLPDCPREVLDQIDEQIEQNVVTLDQLRKESELARMFLRDMVSGQSDSIIPTFFVKCYCPKNDVKEMAVIPVMANFNEDEEKQAIIRQIATELFNRQKVPLAVTIATEAWKAIVPKDAEMEEGWRPRDAEDKQEVSFVLSQTPEGKCVVCFADLTRDEDNNVIIGEFEESFAGDAEGPSILYRFYAEYGRLGMAMLAERISQNESSDDVDLNDLVEEM